MTATTHDIRFMEHALALARKSIGLASPNPAVGCVIVREGEIVGEGFHQYDWRDHAEVAALKSAGEEARGASLYVTLEPCNHTGRTGPCTEAIIGSGVRRVVAAIVDPNPRNSGGGFARLREAGMEVHSGVMEEEARRLIETFARWIRTKKPFVTLKSALTLDGQLALSETNEKAAAKRGAHKRANWISSEESRAEVHRMRHASDAVMTGIGTILVDDPLLTDRSGLPRRRRLLRVVLDSYLRLSPKSRIVQTSDDDLLIFTAAPLKSAKAKRLANAGIELVHAKSRGGRIDLRSVLEELGRRDILSVLLEAGPTMNGGALESGVVDKLFLFYAPKIAGVQRVPLAIALKLQIPPLHHVHTYKFGPDLAIEAYLRDVYRK